MDASREAMEYLYSCFDALYCELGASAPNLTNDAYVVRAFESARSFGEVALEFRAYLGDVPAAPMEPIHATLLEAVADDLSGAMLLYCLVVVIGPRLLVSLHDARALDLDDAARAVLNAGSDALVAEMLAAGEVAKKAPSIEDRHWQKSAQGLADRLESSGYAESFGISR